MQPLVDADILRYEVGFGGQFTNDEGQIVARGWEGVQELLEMKIRNICEEVDATEEPLIFMTNDTVLNKMGNRLRKRRGEKPIELIPNFRNAVATTKVYKGTRVNAKPLHFNNISSHLLHNYNCYIEERGLEADDAMCIEQTSRLGKGDTIICSRDKDLRICQGLHYSWECGKSAAIGPISVDKIGHIEAIVKSGKTTIFGTGLAFFYSQLITGDTADNIPGLPRCGAVAALKTLEGIVQEDALFEATSLLYKDKLGEGWEEYFREQATLLWMVQELDEDGGMIGYDWERFNA